MLLCSEHRAAPAAPPVYLQLVATNPATTHLEVVSIPEGQRPRELQEQDLELLLPGSTLTRTKFRDALGVKNERLGATLETLDRAGRIRHTSAGWQRVD